MTADSIRWREKVACAVGDTASCLYYDTFSVFLIFSSPAGCSTGRGTTLQQLKENSDLG